MSLVALVLWAGSAGGQDGRLAPGADSVVELEDLIGEASVSGGDIIVQPMAGFGPGWGGDAQLFWRPPEPTDQPIRNYPSLSLLFTAPHAGTYELTLDYTVAPDYGDYTVLVAGRPASDVYGFHATVAPSRAQLGEHRLAAGLNQITFTVFGKNAASSGYLVGLDRLALRSVDPVTGDVARGVAIGRQAPAESKSTATPVPPTTPPIADKREYNTPSQPSTAKPPDADTLQRAGAAVCLANPIACCPAGQKSGSGCKLVAEGMLDIRIRSYVPPRFTIMGKNRPWGPDFHLPNIVADKTVGGPFPVHPGCRFNVNQAKHAIEDSKNVLEQALDLAQAWLSQWSGGVEAAKSFVADGVAGGVCGVVDDSDSCRSTVGGAIKSGINVGLASLGIPPELPDIHELRENGIKYLASQAASYAVGELGAMGELPIDDPARQALYDAAYNKASDLLAAELNKVAPSPGFDEENPATWGHLEPAYAPHNAHLYVEVRVKPGLYPTYSQFIAAKPEHEWPALYLHDLNEVYASMGSVEIPRFIPSDGVILPFTLAPSETAGTVADTAPAQIPGAKISLKWLSGKFGVSYEGLVKQQLNFLPYISTNYLYSDWDLGYETFKKAKFRLLSAAAGEVIDWEPAWETYVGIAHDPYSANAKSAVKTTEKEIYNYYGRIDPAPRCDGKPNVAYAE